MLCCAVLCDAILCCIALCCGVLCCFVLYCIMLWCVALRDVMLCHVVSCRVVTLDMMSRRKQQKVIVVSRVHRYVPAMLALKSCGLPTAPRGLYRATAMNPYLTEIACPIPNSVVLFHTTCMIKWPRLMCRK